MHVVNYPFARGRAGYGARVITVIAAVMLVAVTMQAQDIKQAPGGKKISPDLFGLFFEDINYAADGGLYAEMVQNRSFEYSPSDRQEWHPFSCWQYITPGYSYGSVNVETNAPVHPNNPHYVVLNIEHVGDSVAGGVGLRNRGFSGMPVKAGEQYNFSVFAKSVSRAPLTIAVSLQNNKGKVLAQRNISITNGEWKQYTASLVPAEDNDSASLVILATTKGRLALDMVSLFPEKTFKNRPNGLRADLAQLLADIHPKFIRFPGGCLSHGDGLGNMYRWKNTIGPVEQRVEQKNLWGYHQTAGLGYFEYFRFCEDIGAKPLPVLPAAVSCQNSGGTWRIGGTGQQALDMGQMPDYVQEVLDLIEWANGPATSAWGAKRAAAGHPAPFNLEYVGIGNEDKITPEFEQRFRMIYEAVKAKYPNITVIGTVGPFPSGEDFTKGWSLAAALDVPVVDEHYYSQPEWFISNQYRYDAYKRNATKVYVGEYASWGNKVKNAMAEAAYMTALERNGDVVAMASYAPLLAKKGFTQWNPDMIYFSNTRACPTVNYYVQQLFSTNQGDTYFENVLVKDPADSVLAGSCVQDSKTGDLILKVVNAGPTAKSVKIKLARFKKIKRDATCTILTGDADAANTFEQPKAVIPVQLDFKAEKEFAYAASPMSLTVIRIKTK
ncbi:MAG TPA: alpha-L-arabinofuranosidase C-terminal domain-containing protein [Chitinophaga sp.]|uniref:alpha-L-arabinofuranosidase C-terminal domain-containing protein n=1 Tax=Chitinophaga sp. TaxID=1869181 RepID=UPI002DBE65CE|nr:alpha-L-arabinofuranosidase C-terminal domain-containing protein [Chitinophaga sp.]HEU4554944.1 alpha-L-arabinofuranosidase C-terminal domain-containing protein [Chitinophaga sp.]